MKKIFTFLILISLLSLNGYAQKKSLSKKSPTKKALVTYTEDDVKKYIADYFDLYESEYTYSYNGYKKISRNVFQVKVETCRGKSDCFTEHFGIQQRDEFRWSSTVLKLTINGNGKYTVSYVSGIQIY